jgi:hypothetical protein
MIETTSREVRTERRTTTRRDVDLEAIDAGSGARLRALDLSLGGALMMDGASEVRAQPRVEGDAIDLELSLPDEPAPLRLRGFVVRAGAGWLRVCFLDLRRRDMVRLAEHLWS